MVANKPQHAQNSREAAAKQPFDADELDEWRESLDHVVYRHGGQAVEDLLHELERQATRRGVQLTPQLSTPYVNTIPVSQQPEYPGDRELEDTIESLVRWNAMAMVVRANREHSGIGGHLSSYASIATLFEVGFNHFFRAPSDDHPGDFVYLHGHSSPGVYARSFLEGRLSDEQLEHFRREARRSSQWLSEKPTHAATRYLNAG